MTRSVGQASSLSERLAELGAQPVEIATIAIQAPSDAGAALAAAVSELGSYARVAVASPNGARAFLGAFDRSETGPQSGLAPVACVGPSTAAIFDESRFHVDVVPDRNLAEGLVQAVGPPSTPGERLLLVQAEVSRTVLADGFAQAGWLVDRVIAYRTVDGQIGDRDREAARTSDMITFTSSSTVDRFVRLVGLDAMPPVVVSIGPITSATALGHGLVVSRQADPHTLDGLVEAVVQAAVEAAGADG